MKKVGNLIILAMLTLFMAFTSNDKKTIVIDVSHGGTDTGAVVDGISEKDIVLNIANKIKEMNTNSNIDIILTRDSDESVNLKNRVNKIYELKPDLVISLHINFTDDVNKNGREIYLSDKNLQKEKSGDLALKLFYEFKDKKVEIKKYDFYILKNVEYPTTIIELGFLSNKNDREFLTSKEGQIELAKTILNAVK